MENRSELKNKLLDGTVRFDNSDDESAEAFEIELEFSQLSTWDNPYKLFINGELSLSFKTLNSLLNRSSALIKLHNLREQL